MLLANFNRKEHLRHRAVSLRQHGFLVNVEDTSTERHTLNYWKENFAQINKDMSAIDWDTKLAGMTTEDAWSTFRQLVKNSVLENVPTRTRSRAVARIADRTAKNCTGHVT